jgi:O-antigen ligase
MASFETSGYAPPPRGEQRLVICLLLLLLFPAWFRGGTTAASQAPLAFLALAVVVAALAAGGGPPAARRLFAQPVFWLGLAFLLPLTVQTWNAGRYLFFSPTLARWTYTRPRVPWLPAAVSRPEGLEMLRWFFPAWVLVSVLHAGFLGAAGSRLLLWGMAWNAGLLAAFGLVQYLSGTRALYWRQPMDAHFFAAFGYPNHAGAYFLLMFSLAAGLLVDEVAGGGPRRLRPRHALTGAALLLAFLAANLSFSRAVVLLSAGLSIGAALYGAHRAWRTLSPAVRLNVAVALAAAFALAALALAALAGRSLAEELAPRHLAAGLSAAARRERLALIAAALRMWREQPWFGVGGWGYGRWLCLYLPREAWPLLVPGMANLHNDPVQFLAEFGIVGGGLMAAVAVLLVRRIVRAPHWRRPLVVLPLAGAALTVAHSLIDLPFRCPAVLYAWLAILAALPAALRAHTSAPRPRNTSHGDGARGRAPSILRASLESDTGGRSASTADRSPPP